MTNINDALENLADVYMSRDANERFVRAKYAEFERELAAAQQEDIKAVAVALKAAWDAGASVASTGRAMGTTNVYAARRKYYDAAKALQGEVQEEDAEFLETLYNRVRGTEVPPEPSEEFDASDKAMIDAGVYTTSDVEDWVQSWTVTATNVDNVWKVEDPEGRVESIVNGLISGYPGNRGEFMKDVELHHIVHEVHGIDTKEFD